MVDVYDASNATLGQSTGFALDAWQKIRLQQLKLSAFRNYAHLQLDFADRHVVLSGQPIYWRPSRCFLPGGV